MPEPRHKVFTHRIAVMSDIPEIKNLMAIAITELQKSFLTPIELKASRETMGLDNTLIKDQTYYVILHAEGSHNETIVGCGGWGKRATLFGGSHSVGRSEALLDSNSDPARIRAMYTHPDWVRKGIGSYIIALGEYAAKENGFKRMVMGATLSGQPLYEHCGYVVAEKINEKTSTV